MTKFDNIREEGLLLYEYIRGSQSHGLATETSDVDTGGIYIAPKEEFFSLKCEEQIADDKNDNVWLEIGKFMELISKSNPNALEALFVPEECVLFEHPVITELKKHRDEFITKDCFNSFGGYAVSQIKRARGLNKMITMPETFDKKTPLDFCYTHKEQGSVPMKKWLEERGMNQEFCGLVNIPNMPGVYGVYYKEGGHYKGICGENSNTIRFSSIPKGEEPVCFMTYNDCGYQKHCVDYKNFKEWEKKRNPVRYQSNLRKNYDAKNMCECFRLLTMAVELAKGEGFKCDRRNIDREFLLDIKGHKFEYDELMVKLEALKAEMDEAVKVSKLKEHCDTKSIEEILIDIRKKFYV